MEHPVATPPFTERLRAETATAHTQLEDLPISKAIISPAISKELYTNYLALMHDVVKDTEINIAPLTAAIITDIDARKKTQLLEADLEYLGASKTNYNKVLSHNINITPAFALGILYVVEGSSLGGRVILKNIGPALNLTESAGAQYFSGYGATTGSTWRNFIGMMEGYIANGNYDEEVIAGANFAFEAIKKHLEKNTAV